MHKNIVIWASVPVIIAAAGFAAVLWAASSPSSPTGTAMTDYRKPSDQELRQKLDPQQYQVTQQCGTEPPFKNAYWDNHAPGIYLDVVSGEPLFSSLDKFDSGTGWPSFSRPLEDKNLVEKSDNSLFMRRTEVRSKHGDSHLGHLFDDGPAPTGQRFCINSAALRFVPAAQLTAAGYGQFAGLFPDVEQQPAPTTDHARSTAILAGGCFWGMEEIVRKLPGVIDVEAGYTGGALANPTYQDVHGGRTGHAEAIKIIFDPKQISYQQLLGYFFRMHDPTTPNRQGNDLGSQYRSAVFYLDDRQRAVAEQVKAAVDAAKKWPRPVVTEIVAAGPWWPAEGYHQDYLQKNPGGYTCHWLRD